MIENIGINMMHQIYQETVYKAYINYQLDIDKDRKFYTIDELIGKEIKTGNQSSVTIEDINVGDKNTTVVLKANGDYSNLNQIVLIEKMNIT